jgi:hypothetical protein
MFDESVRAGLAALILALPAVDVAAAEEPGQCRAPGDERAARAALWCGPAGAAAGLLEQVQYCPYGVGYYCITPYGTCQLYQPLCIGAPCYCPTVYGPV